MANIKFSPIGSGLNFSRLNKLATLLTSGRDLDPTRNKKKQNKQEKTNKDLIVLSSNSLEKSIKSNFFLLNF